MSVGDIPREAPGSAAAVIARPILRSLAFRPATVFTVLSLLFGALIVVLTPPLRGPDETAHFVRAYSVARGDVVAVAVDAEGRKGTWLPARVHSGFDFFEDVRRAEKPAGFGYRQVLRQHFARAPDAADAPEQRPVFVPFEGSEGYSAVAYVPQVVGAWLARVLGLDFLPTLYLMRLAGLIATTAIIAGAVALAGPLGWPFLAIAMLPSALYGRSVISADGTAFAFALMTTALFVHALRRTEAPPAERAAWQALSALTKPPNLAFVLLELFGRPTGRVSWAARLSVIAPAVILAVVWTLAGSADVAAWRLAEIHTLDIQQFDPMRKLAAMLENPLAFPVKAIATLRDMNPSEMLSQVVGVLGLFDTVLQHWTYPTIAALVVASFATSSDLDAPARRRAALGAAVTTLVYTGAIFLIFYLVWTPLDSPTIWGVQGRYFVPVLPLVAVLTAVLARGLPAGPIAFLATAAASLSGWACVEAILRADWPF